MHVNMFSYGHSRSEVREGLNQHQKRDGRILSTLDIVFGLCLLFLVRHLSADNAAAIVVGAIAGISAMRYFVDQSVRNFFLHRLDWDEAESRPDDNSADPHHPYVRH